MSVEFIKEPAVIWFIIGVFMLMIEMMGMGFITFLFFGIGAWVVAAWCYFGEPTLNQQLGVFIVTSVITLVVFRRHMKSIFFGEATPSGDIDEAVEEYVGKKAHVIKAISPSKDGKIEFKGAEWTAEADEEIGVGETVQIIERVSIKLKVKRI